MKLRLFFLNLLLRNVRKEKLISLINIAGITVGFTCFILISLYINDEVSYDRFHIKKDNIYRLIRVNNNLNSNVDRKNTPRFPMAMRDDLVNYFPEIQCLTRMKGHDGIIRYKDRMFRESVNMTDEDFFQIFTFPMIYGDPETALVKENSIVLTQSLAKKYLGDEIPLGKVLSITFGNFAKDYIVTGVLDDIPQNSSIQFQCLINLSNYGSWEVPERRYIYTHRGNFNMEYYILLKSNVSEEHVKEKFVTYYDHYFIWYTKQIGWEGEGNPFSFGLQRMKDIHLDASVQGGTNPADCLILGGIALLVLIIACINYINLTVSASRSRSKEIGMRKVLGAGKQNLVFQFCIESLLLSGIAIVIGMLLSVILLPQFNTISGKILEISNLFQANIIIMTVTVVVITSILTGSYPALVMANYEIKDLLKNRIRKNRKSIFGRSFVVIQFFLSVFLIGTSLLIDAQLKFLLNKDTGIDSDGLLAINIQENSLEEQSRIAKLLKDDISSNPKIHGATISTTDFSVGSGERTGFEINGLDVNFMDCMVDYNFVHTLGLKIIEGRDFSREFSLDEEAVLVNQKFAQLMGHNLQIGKTLGDRSKGWPFNLRVIGLLEDFNFQSLHNEIDPALFHLYTNFFGAPYILVKISSTGISDTIAFLEDSWVTINPDKPFVFHFLSDTIEKYYLKEMKWDALVKYSSVLAVLIACMGILGLTALNISSQVKEIGVRRVFGAKISQIIRLVLKNIIVLIVAANVIAWPVVYIVVQKFLQKYPYRIEIGAQYFLLGLIVSIGIAISTTLYFTIKAAMTNPVDSLRNE